MNLKALLYAAEAIPTLMDKIEPAKSSMRSRDFYDLDRYMESVHTINESLQIMSSLYYPSSMTAVSNDMRYSVYSSQDIFMAMDDEDENIFLNLYKDYTLSSILEASPNLIGISITNTSQIIPGLTLAKLIKDQNKEIHITVGGSVFTKLIENIIKLDRLFSIVDSFIVFEGEHGLLNLIEQLEECSKWGIAFHLYIIVGFPTETKKEALDTLDFILKKDFLTSPGYSCLPSLFGMEKDSPLTHTPADYGLRKIMSPKNEDVGLGYSYEVERGISPEEAEKVYHHVIGRLSKELCPFPYNYSIPGGLLYISHIKQKYAFI